MVVKRNVTERNERERIKKTVCWWVFVLSNSGKNWPQRKITSSPLILQFYSCMLRIVCSVCGFNFPAHGPNYSAFTHNKNTAIPKDNMWINRKWFNYTTVGKRLLWLSGAIHSTDECFRSKSTNQIFLVSVSTASSRYLSMCIPLHGFLHQYQNRKQFKNLLFVTSKCHVHYSIYCCAFVHTTSILETKYYTEKKIDGIMAIRQIVDASLCFSAYNTVQGDYLLILNTFISDNNVDHETKTKNCLSFFNCCDGTFKSALYWFR